MTREQQQIHDEAARYWAQQQPHTSPLDDDDQPRGMYSDEEWADEQAREAQPDISETEE